MAARRISVALDEATIQRARQRAGSGGLSSYLAAALREKLERDEQQEVSDEERRRAILAWLHELDEADPPTPEERERAARRAAEILAAMKAPHD